MKKFLFILGFAFLFLVSGQTVSAASLNLTSTTPKVGEEFGVEIHLDTQNQETLGTDVVLSFNPQFLEVKEIKEGKLYPSYPSKEINNNQGKIYFSGVANYDSPVSTSGVLGEIKFLAKKQGETQISFEWQLGRTDLTSIVPYEGKVDLLVQPPALLRLSIEKQTLMGKIIELIRRLVRFLPF